MRVSRRRGRLRIGLEAEEATALSRLLDDLATLLRVDDADDADDAVLTRLFPSAYPDDAEAEADYREITESGLRTERLERIAACAGDVASPDGAELDLGDEDTAQRWLRTLNDLRLAIGTRIGVSEDEAELDLQDPQLSERVLYHWLTALQDSMVVGLMD